MEVTKEVLTKSIRGMPDDVLLKRWASQMFTDEALPIAAEEIRVRGLDTSQEALIQANLRDKEQAREYRSHQFAKIGRGCLYVILTIVAVAVATVLKMVLPLIFR
mgnify:CR=1 FL=1|jgi:hypothetical protein